MSAILVAVEGHGIEGARGAIDDEMHLSHWKIAVADCLSYDVHFFSIYERTPR
jgi:hypothetical protein